MNKYGKENLPKLDQPTNKKYYSSSALNYLAADISTAETSLKNELSILKSDIEDAIASFNKQLETLEKEFGTNFIAINNKPLGFVDTETFTTLTKTLSTTIENNEEETASFFASCKLKIEEINTWLTELSTNCDIVNQYEKQYQRYINSSEEEYQAKASTYLSLLNEYERLPEEPSTYGDWIKE